MRKIYALSVCIVVLAAMLHTVTYGEEHMRLSLSECLNRGLENNLDIKIAKIEALVEGEDVLLAESIFDTILKGKATYTDDKRATMSPAFGTEKLNTLYEVGIEKKLPTGSTFNIDYSDGRSWSDSAFVSANPLHTAELSFTLTQPVLNNFFGYVDRRSVKLSKLEAEIADLSSLNAIEDVVADIQKAYWQVVFAYQNVALSTELLEQAEELYGIFSEHIKTGIAEETELYETEANMRIKKADLLVAENNLRSASNNLRLLLNMALSLSNPRDCQFPFQIISAPSSTSGQPKLQ